MNNLTVDRRQALGLIGAAFTTALVPACNNLDTGTSISSNDVIDRAQDILSKGGYAYSRDQVLKLSTQGMVYFVGDVHTREYRLEAAGLFKYLAANQKIENIGIEGLFGDPRSTILEERYQVVARIIGQDAANRVKEDERPIYDPIRPFIEGKIISEGVPVKVFGLEEYDQFIRLETVAYQLELVDALLERFTDAIRADKSILKGKIIDFLESDPVARDLHNGLLEIVSRIGKDKDLERIIGDAVPLFSRELFEDPPSLGEFINQLARIKKEEALFTRDKIAAQQIAANTNAADSSHVVYMGWFHINALLHNASKSALIAHPIQDPVKREAINLEILNSLKGFKDREIHF